MFVFTVFIIISAIAAPGAAAFGSMKSVFSTRIIHNENPDCDCALFCVILTVNNHCENAFSSSIIHLEKASPEKILRKYGAITLSQCFHPRKKNIVFIMRIIVRISRK